MILLSRHHPLRILLDQNLFLISDIQTKNRLNQQTVIKRSKTNITIIENQIKTPQNMSTNPNLRQPTQQPNGSIDRKEILRTVKEDIIRYIFRKDTGIFTSHLTPEYDSEQCQWRGQNHGHGQTDAMDAGFAGEHTEEIGQKTRNHQGGHDLDREGEVGRHFDDVVGIGQVISQVVQIQVEGPSDI